MRAIGAPQPNLSTGDATLISECASLKRRFLDQHLGRWLGPFLLALHDGAQTSFYETLAKMTERLVRLAATAGKD